MRRGPRLIDGVREQTGDPSLDRMQQTGLDLARSLKGCPFLVGKMKSVRFVAGVHKVVNHKLGTLAACFHARFNYDPGMSGPIFAESAPSFQAGLDPNSQISLVCNVNCDVDLWFYPRASKPINLVTGVSDG